MSFARPLTAGLAGAIALNVVHETARAFVPRAPRIDRVGKRAVTKIAGWLGRPPPRGWALYATALAGDLASNAVYYALVSRSRRPTLAGLVLGAAAGASTVVLTPMLGLGRNDVRRSTATACMTVAWYTLGGLTAGLVARR